MLKNEFAKTTHHINDTTNDQSVYLFSNNFLHPVFLVKGRFTSENKVFDTKGEVQIGIPLQAASQQ